MNNKRVLVVDDDELICTLIRLVLEDDGYTVDTATGCKALNLAARWTPDLILLDLTMPIMDGPAVRKELLTDPRTASVPVVLMSSDDRGPWAARKMQAQAYLPKPFNIDDLLDLVHRQITAA